MTLQVVGVVRKGVKGERCEGCQRWERKAFRCLVTGLGSACVRVRVRVRVRVLVVMVTPDQQAKKTVLWSSSVFEHGPVLLSRPKANGRGERTPGVDCPDEHHPPFTHDGAYHAVVIVGDTPTTRIDQGEIVSHRRRQERRGCDPFQAPCSRQRSPPLWSASQAPVTLSCL